ncbi:hypothetical protein WR25_02557 [Diploscapter pachys]|uniref:Peptidase M14 domain-containing protein n=1 Tax=Diploscapter pachys TaxID=2018661 RepID=A0A2A2KUC1_9BILA|nr:hypothetical protein WR25_02557 [Diploscapter pachys]
MSPPSTSSTTNSSRNDDLVKLFDQMIIAVCGSRHKEAIKCAERIRVIWPESDMTPLVRHFTGKTKSRKKNKELHGIKGLLRAVEMCSDDCVLTLLCSIIHVLAVHGNESEVNKRLRRLVKADATSSLIRCLRGRLKHSIKDAGEQSNSATKSYEVIEAERLAQATNDQLADVIIKLGSKDMRLALKVRVGGLLSQLAALLAALDILRIPYSMLKLTCRTLRSARNAQVLSRQKGILSRFMSNLDFLLTNATVLVEREEQRHRDRLYAQIEILYFVTKNRKARIQLINDGIVQKTFQLTHHYLCFRREIKEQQIVFVPSCNFSYLDVCLVALALLRLLANNKRAKDILISCGTVELCEKEIGMVVREKPPPRQLDEQTAIKLKQLPDSICSLCLRCLQHIPFPLTGVSFPLRMELPQISKRRSTSKSPMRTPTKAIAPVVRQRTETLDDTQPSSDDEPGLDEEDAVFENMESEAVITGTEGEEDVNNKNYTILHTRLKSSELANYEKFFAEFKEGANVDENAKGVQKEQEWYMDKLIEDRCQVTRSVVPFVKAAFPDVSDANDVDLMRQPLCPCKDSIKMTNFRDTVVQEMARIRMNDPFPATVVYDLDALLADCPQPSPSKPPTDRLKCDDRNRIGKLDSSRDHLTFESRFESGNLRRATQVGPYHYELILSPDVNQVHDHYQWFYFEVSNIKSDVKYTFEIINCMKTTSMYSKGMQPVMYSVKEMLSGRPGWQRVGDNVCYYRNLYTTKDDCDANGEETKKKYFYSIRFNVTFRYKGDICYFAYHYPYTYSYLRATLDESLSRLPSTIYSRMDHLTLSLGGNPVPLITVTAPGTKEQVAARPIILISARVHPGETNASWIMHGIISMLLTSTSPTVSELREKFVIKLIPMLNPDGVINGSHRCSLSGNDLNRAWDRPNEQRHPEIYHSKAIVQYMVEVLKKPPFVYVDLHGHSRKSNVFLFGNNPEESWNRDDVTQRKHNYEFITLPEMLEQISPAFSFKNCRFNIERSKESSARITLWRQFDLCRSYTMESTYCGFESGQFKGSQIGTRELKDMGKELLAAILEVKRVSELPSSGEAQQRQRKAHSPSTPNSSNGGSRPGSKRRKSKTKEKTQPIKDINRNDNDTALQEFEFM